MTSKVTSDCPSSPMQKKESISVMERYALPYYSSCILYTIVWAVYVHTNEPAYMLAIAFTLPMLGKFFPNDSYPVFNSIQHNKNIFQVFPLVANILFTWITMGIIFIDYPIKEYTTQQRIQLYSTLLLLVPASIDASHELIHRPQWPFKILGFINMSLFQFTVYPIEHLYLHHKYVGTDKDPITSPKNQNLYTYTIKAYFSAHKFVFSYNKLYFAICMLTNWLYLGLVFVCAFKQYQDFESACWKVAFFVAVGLGGFFFLQIVEYIEHYGLIYRQDVDKKEINQISSWNAEENIFYNWLIFRFQRHSDHHMNAYKVFTTLQLTEKMPRFPFSFFDGVLMAFLPPLWHYVMNPYVDEVIQKKPIEKSHREKVKWIKNGVGLIVFIHLWINVYNAYRARQIL